MARQPDTPGVDAARFRAGSRGSPLAVAQTREVIARLVEAGVIAPGDAAVEVIRVTGDRIVDRPLAEAGGKGLFTKEIDAALRAGAIELAVHSMKDLPTSLPEGIALACVLPREDPRDVLFGARSIAALPDGAVIGTASLRRSAQVRHARPDVRVAPLRGNVKTRLRKLREGEVEATLLALAGLRRLGIAPEDGGAILDPEEMLPAPGQGAIAVTVRDGDESTRALLAHIDDAASAQCVAAERALLAALDGSCRTPIAALAELDGETLRLRGCLLSPDGAQRFDAVRVGAAPDAEALGADAGAELRAAAGPGFRTG